jgi:hypothetical protein
MARRWRESDDVDIATPYGPSESLPVAAQEVTSGPG